ncbi:MAG TPA: MCP four helix bundle domain-containing protein, partial [Candidatus Competibacter sp.]|nr:MCP four helix bundle domain-containing protein [Candidatus Competibacter sp.]
MNIANLKISTRLNLGFGIVVAFLAGIALFGITSMGEIKSDLDNIVSHFNYKTELNQRMSESVHIVARVTRTIILLSDNEIKKREYHKIEAARGEYDKAWEALQALPVSEAGKALRVKIAEARDKVRSLNNKVLELAFADKKEEATTALLQEAGPATQQWQDSLDDNIKLQKEGEKHAVEEATATYITARAWMFTLSGIAITLGIAISFFITRSVVRPLGGEPATIAGLTGQIARGDLTVQFADTGKETGIYAAMREMAGQLKEMVGKVTQSTAQVNATAAEIAQGSGDLAQRTEE